MAKLLFVVIVLTCFVSNVNADQLGNYVGISSGALLTQKKNVTDRDGSTAVLEYDTVGIPVNVFIGHQFDVGLRVEGEAFYKRSTISGINMSGTDSKVDGTVWLIGAMGNLYYDWYHYLDGMAGDWFSPYFGLGAGFAEAHVPGVTVDRNITLWNSGSDFVFAYQLTVGNSTPIANDLFFDVSYRYFATRDLNIDQIRTSYSNQNILLGLRYVFR